MKTSQLKPGLIVDIEPSTLDFVENIIWPPHGGSDARVEILRYQAGSENPVHLFRFYPMDHEHKVLFGEDVHQKLRDNPLIPFRLSSPEGS